jgi:ABC-type molybdate transport system substrate-binding protein
MTNPGTPRSTNPLHRLLATLLALAATSTLAAPQPASAAEPLRVLAAGSLKNAFTEIISQWQAIHPEQPVSLISGPAGWLRERIEQGEAFDLYASAALTHAEAIHREGWSGHAVLFAHNALCAQVRSDTPVNSDSIVDYLLLPATRLATSTPKSDPGGDYTWTFFQRLDKQHPGAYATLTAKAQQLYGSAPDPAKPKISISTLIADNKLDASIGYCSGTKQNVNTGLKSIALPAPAPTADYGLSVSRKAGMAAAEFALFVLSPAGQQILADNGFSSIGLPSE